MCKRVTIIDAYKIQFVIWYLDRDLTARNFQRLKILYFKLKYTYLRTLKFKLLQF